MDAKIYVASMTGTSLILRPRPPNIMNTSLSAAFLYLLDMLRQLGKVHVIRERSKSTLLLQISIGSCDEPSHLIPAIRNREVAYFDDFNKAQYYPRSSYQILGETNITS